MLEDKPTRWQQVVLAERYNGRRQGERKREREGFIWVFLQLTEWVKLWVTSAQMRSFSRIQYVCGSEETSEMTEAYKDLCSISHIYLNFTRLLADALRNFYHCKCPLRNSSPKNEDSVFIYWLTFILQLNTKRDDLQNHPSHKHLTGAV